MALPPHRPLRELRLKLALWRGKRAILKIVRPVCPAAGLITIAAPRFNPPRLALWIKTRTDAERDDMRHADDLLPKFREALVASGYPPDGAKSAWFAFESQETVDRDYEGSWYHATK